MSPDIGDPSARSESPASPPQEYDQLGCSIERRGTVARLDGDGVVRPELRGDRSDDEILHLVVEGARRNHECRAPFRGAEIGEWEWDENDVATLIACRRRHRPDGSRTRSSSPQPSAS